MCTEILLLLALLGPGETDAEIVGLPLTGEEAMQHDTVETPTAEPTGLALHGEEAEAFLLSADVVDLESYTSKGTTNPRIATLSDGERTARAQFKVVDTVYPRIKLTGMVVLRLVDTYRHEIAAFQLDRLLGLDMVPPCVERKIGRETGSLCLWIENGLTETERKSLGITAPDIRAYNNQMHDLKMFLQLTWDTDYNNISNIMFDGNWKLYKIDSSRAFRANSTLRRPEALTRFRRSTLESLRTVDRDQLDEALAPWVSPKAIKALWMRRTELIERADRLIDVQGEEAVLFD